MKNIVKVDFGAFDMGLNLGTKRDLTLHFSYRYVIKFANLSA